MKINDSLINRFNEFNSWALKAKNIYGEYRTREERYDLQLDGLPFIKPYQSIDCYSALHLYPIQLDISKKVVKDREQIFYELRENHVGVNVHYIPIHLQPYYQNIGFKNGDFPNSERYYEGALSLPLFASMTFDQQDEIVSILSKIVQ